MAESELYRKGIALRSQLLGESFVDSMNQSTYQDPIMQKFRDVAAETVFGALWTRPGLDLKTRALVCVVSDTTTFGSALMKASAISCAFISPLPKMNTRTLCFR